MLGVGLGLNNCSGLMPDPLLVCQDVCIFCFVSDMCGKKQK